MVTDEQGNMVSEQNYYPYGQTRASEPESQNTTERQYTGQVSDQPQTGLYYYNARYYSPQTAGFTQADTQMGPNRYLYALNNPIKHIDPTGKQVEMSMFTGEKLAEPPSISDSIPEISANTNSSTVNFVGPVTDLVTVDPQYAASYTPAPYYIPDPIQYVTTPNGARADFGMPQGIVRNMLNLKNAIFGPKGSPEDIKYYAGNLVYDVVGTGLIVGTVGGGLLSLLSPAATAGEQALTEQGVKVGNRNLLFRWAKRMAGTGRDFESISPVESIQTGEIVGERDSTFELLFKTIFNNMLDDVEGAASMLMNRPTNPNKILAMFPHNVYSSRVSCVSNSVLAQDMLSTIGVQSEVVNISTRLLPHTALYLPELNSLVAFGGRILTPGAIAKMQTMIGIK